ncbi:MAG TPA: hypothetical protein VF746_12880 [Longimicrobium sp.]|jgi:hypothetical protein
MGFFARRLRGALARVRPVHLEPLAVLAAALALNALAARGARPVETGGPAVLEPGRTGPTVLEPGQRMHVAYESTSCFHSMRASISLTPQPEGRLRYSSSVEDLARRGTRSGVLDPAQVARLERGLASYRRGSGCRSTITQKVTITIYEQGIPVRSERYRRSCAEADEFDFAELLPM